MENVERTNTKVEVNEVQEKKNKLLAYRKKSQKKIDDFIAKKKTECDGTNDPEAKKKLKEEARKELDRLMADVRAGQREIWDWSFLDKSDYLATIRSAPENKHIAIRDKGVPHPIQYVPIGIQEAIADYIFSDWNIQNLQYMELQSGVVICTISIYFIPSYPGASESTVAGTASGYIEPTSKGSAKEAFAGKLKSQALSNGLESLGNVFGKNLGRDLPNNYLL